MADWKQLAAWARTHVSQSSTSSKRITDRIVDALHAMQSAATSSEIAERIEVDLVKTRDAIRRLEKQGWIQRTGERTKNREMRYIVTQKGLRRDGRGGVRR